MHDFFSIFQIMLSMLYYNYTFQTMSLKDFEKVSKLGQGAYSTVYKVLRVSDKQEYALKRIKIMSLSQKQKQNSLNQIRILASINHPNIISYKEAFIDQSTKSLCIIMEYAEEGDLGHKIEQKIQAKATFPEVQIWDALEGIVKGLAQLHRCGVYHRDLKPANIFLCKQGNKIIPKIGDMNVSKISQNNLCMTQTGTPYYASPEVWKDLPYDSKSDIWSLGCIIYEMITLKPPFQAQDMQGLHKKVTRGIYPKISSVYSNDLSSVIRSLLQVNADSRPTCQKILSSPAVVKHINVQLGRKSFQQNQLMKTIRGENFNQLNQMLPKANYMPVKQKKERGIKSLMDDMDEKLGMTRSKSNRLILDTDQKAIIDTEKVPKLSKLSKSKSKNKYDHTDRLYIKDKQNLNILTRERKQSQMSLGRNIQLIDTKKSIHNVGESQLKLPRVQSRYNRIKQRINKQNSLRIHKIFQ